MKSQFREKALSIILSFNLLLNSFAPFFSIVPVVNSQEITPEVITTVDQTPVDVPTPTQEITVEPTQEVTPTEEVLPTAEVTVEPTVEPIPSQTEIPVVIPGITTEVSPTVVVETPLQSVQDDTPTPNPLEVTNSPSPPETAPTEAISTPDVTGVVETAVVESYSCRADSLNGCLTTDKSDYAPTDVVLITGHGFSSNTDYTLRVVSTDQPAVDSSYLITTGENGSFAYSYQLDGSYRPNYLVELKNDFGFVVASVTFTDGPTQIEYNDFEGEIAPQESDNWTNGNISGYKENDTIRFRLDLTASAAGSGNLFIGFTSDPTCRFFKFQAPTSVSGTGVFSLVSYVPPLVQNGSDAVANFAITSTGAGTGKLNFTLQLSDGAAGCASGSSQHVQVDDTSGGVKWSGNKALPIPANAVAPVTDITISKTAPLTKSIGQSIAYSLTVTNLDSSTTATSVVVTDTLPTGVSFVSGSWTKTSPSATGSCTALAQIVTCNIGNLSGGATSTITINGTVNNNTQLCSTTQTNTTSVSTTTLESNSANNSSQASTDINPCLGTLTVNKNVVPSNDTGKFNLQIDGSTAGTGADVGNGGSTGAVTVTSASHTVSETAGTDTSLTDYTSVIGGDCASTGSVTVSAGQNKVCSITNTRNTGTLQVLKNVDLNGDGDYTDTNETGAIDWKWQANAGTNHNTGDAAITVNTGDYALTETAKTDFHQVSLSCTGGTLTSNSVAVTTGANVVCTFVNARDTGTITFTKVVTNNYGGTLGAADFPLFIDGNSVTSGTPNTLLANRVYTLTETQQTGYTGGYFTGDCNAAGSISLAVGDNKTCTITNYDVQPKLTVTKVVINDNGGTKEITDFPLFVDSLSVKSGAQTGLNAGTYTVSETGDSGYTSSITGDCSSNGSITLSVGDVKSCTITNDDIQPTLSIYKVCDPAGDTGLFNLQIDDSNVTSDTICGGWTNGQIGVTVGSHTVGETGGSGTDLSNYTSVITGDCTSNGDVTLAAGNNKSCTITNTKKGSISGYKYEDKSGDTTDSGDQTSVQGLLVELWHWVTDVFVDTGKTEITDSDGFYEFLDLIPGVYQVREILSSLGAGWTNITSTSVDVTVDPGESDEDNNFINTQYGTIIVEKQTVPNGDQTSFDFDLSYGDNDADLSDGQQDSTGNLLPGSYSVSENTPAGWDLTSTVCTSSIQDVETAGDLELDSGETITCVFTNSRKPTLTLVKTVVNNNGGTAVANDFQGKINDGDVPWSVAQTLNPGSYTASETTLPNYTASIWGTNCNADGTITLAYGDNRTCTITNDDKPGSITITKNAVPNAGRDFNFTSSNAAIPSFSLDDDGNNTLPKTMTFSGLSAGSYVITEGADTRWNLTNIVCVDPDSGTTRNIGNRRANIDLDLGEDITCTFTNRRRPQLTVIKHVINDNNGQLTAPDFTISVTGVSPSLTSFAGSEAGTLVILNPGDYSVDETELSSYAKSLSLECLGTLAYGDQKTCTVTNDDKPGTLIVEKVVINDNGGDKDSSDFTMSVTGSNVSPSSFAGDESGTAVTLDAGSYGVDESGPSGYAADYSENCSGTITNGETLTCTVTNDDIAPKLTLVKTVINDNGGSATSDQFGLTINGNAINSGETTELVANTEYTIDETGLEGYTFVSITGDEECPTELGGTLTLDPGDDVTCTITNDDEIANLIIIKHVINDNGGSKVASDFTMDVTGDNVNSPSFPGDEQGTSVTLDAGNYSVSESGPVGYADSYSDDCNGNIKNGETKTCTVTNDDQYGKVTVVKYNDKNGNGEKDDGEEVLSDWTIKLTGNGTQITDENGQVIFEPVMPGDYTLDEIMQKGWQQTAISCIEPEEPTVTPTPTDSITPTVTPTPEPSTNICHWNEGADKWNAIAVPLSNPGHDDHELDFEYDGNIDSNGHPVHDSQTTDPALDGDLWCEVNDPRRLTRNILGVGRVEAATTNPDGYQLSVSAEENVECIIGNQRINPELQISKSNDGEDKSPGGTVIYTIKIKALSNKVLGVKVKDLLPKGFSIQNVISIIRNGIDDITTLVGDPGYHSPGTYNLGDMEENDEIVIKYQAKIDGSQEFGLYKDAAWADGTDDIDSRVLALAQPEGYVSTNFVGTGVRVNGNLTESGNVNLEGEVLGASTYLPATGANSFWIYFGSIMAFLGILIIAGAFMIKKTKIFLAALLLVGLLIVAKPAQASDLTIRLSEPKTPTKINNFKIDFVTLDLTDSGNPITVKCFYKKNLGDGWTQYGSDIIVAAPGNNGSCQEVSSFVNTSGTTYYFKSTASNGVVSDDSEAQGLVSVGYDDRDPTVPTNYKKEKISSCQYKISFKTADDGMTSRVEVYRSETTSITLDGSTRVGDITIGPNTEGSFTESVPDCNKTYYYIIRAFNVAGNASGPIGDSITVVTSSTTTSEQGAIPVSGGTLAAETGGSVLGEGTDEGEVKGEASGSGKPEVINVKGSMTQKVVDFVTKKKKLTLLIVALAAAIGYAVYYGFKKKKDRVV